MPEVDKKAAAKFQRRMRAARRELDMAIYVIDDGALISGARYLRKAADLFEQAQAIRNAELDRLVKESA